MSERFSSADIERIKACLAPDSEALALINALLEVANAAFWYWNAVDDLPHLEKKSHALYKSLEAVDWMQESSSPARDATGGSA